MTAPSTARRLGGVIAAVLVPRIGDGSVDAPALESNFRALFAAGVDGISIGGATGEYAQQDPQERLALLRAAGQAAAAAGRIFIPAVGAGHMRQSCELAEAAADCGAAAVLLPPPLFFRYSQGDLLAYFTEAARRFPLPVLIYNLPAFVSPVSAETAVELIGRGVAGIKDSSGLLDILTAYTGLTPTPVRFVGNDSALLPALAAGVCDGGVSGVAGVLPELLMAIMDPATREAKAALFLELLARTDGLPTPWSLKVIAEARGWGTATFPFAPSAERVEETRSLRAWIDANLQELTAVEQPSASQIN